MRGVGNDAFGMTDEQRERLLAPGWSDAEKLEKIRATLEVAKTDYTHSYWAALRVIELIVEHP